MYRYTNDVLDISEFLNSNLVFLNWSYQRVINIVFGLSIGNVYLSCKKVLFQTWKKVGTEEATHKTVSEAKNYIMNTSPRGVLGTNIESALTKAVEILSSSRRTE